MRNLLARGPRARGLVVRLRFARKNLRVRLTNLARPIDDVRLRRAEVAVVVHAGDTVGVGVAAVAACASVTARDGARPRQARHDRREHPLFRARPAGRGSGAPADLRGVGPTPTTTSRRIASLIAFRINPIRRRCVGGTSLFSAR